MEDETNENGRTAIAVSSETKELLEKRKVHPRQSFDEVIRELLAKAQAAEISESGG